MKKNLLKAVFVLGLSLSLTSCYVQTHVVGKGAQGNTKVQKWNHYVIGGLVPVGVSKPEDLAGGAKDYTVVTKHSFLNGLVSSLTFGIYNPTTTTVTK
jgi:hypothetical protein